MQMFLVKCLLTVVLPLAGPGTDAGFGCDRHHRLSDGFLPALADIPSHAGRRQCRVVVQDSVILPDIVNHVGCDHLEAVRVAALGEAAEVLRRLHLEDLGQGDLLWVVKEVPLVGRSSTFSSETQTSVQVKHLLSSNSTCLNHFK